MSSDHTWLQTVYLGGLGWVRDCEAIVIDRKSCDCLSRNCGICSLEKGREKFLPEGLLHRLEAFPKALGGALQKIPLLMERMMKAHISGLRVTVCHSQHCIDTVRPVPHLLPHPRRLWPRAPNVPPKLSAANHYHQLPPTEEALVPGIIAR